MRSNTGNWIVIGTVLVIALAVGAAREALRKTEAAMRRLGGGA